MITGNDKYTFKLSGSEDPHEQRDLAAERPDVCSELARCYLDWHDEMMATQPEGFFHDPMWEELHRGGPCHAHGHLAGYCGRLERTGRGWAVPLLKERHPEEFR